jgi:hypothetical protein
MLPLLLAQEGAAVETVGFGRALFAAAGGLIAVGLVVFFLVLLFGYLRGSREMAHLERVKSLECGLPLEEPKSSRAKSKFMHNAFWISFWMVALVPYTAFSAAAAATSGGERSVPFAVAVWLFAGLASVAAVTGATVLMLASRGEQRLGGVALGKPNVEKDVYV